MSILEHFLVVLRVLGLRYVTFLRQTSLPEQVATLPNPPLISSKPHSPFCHFLTLSIGCWIWFPVLPSHSKHWATLLTKDKEQYDKELFLNLHLVFSTNLHLWDEVNTKEKSNVLPLKWRASFINHFKSFVFDWFSNVTHRFWIIGWSLISKAIFCCWQFVLKFYKTKKQS